MLFRYDFLSIFSAAAEKEKDFRLYLALRAVIAQSLTAAAQLNCMQFNLVPFAAAQFDCAKPITAQPAAAGDG